MKYLISVLISAALLTGCDLLNPPGDIIICTVKTKENQACSPVLSLKLGELILKGKDLSFELTADYEACFQSEKIKFTGQYEQRGQSHIQDIELLAQEMKILDEGKIKDFPKTIGLISLNLKSNKGHFVDIWATTQAYGKSDDLPANAEVHCQSELTEH